MKYRVPIKKNKYIELWASDIFDAYSQIIDKSVLRGNFEVYKQGRWLEIEL